MKVSVLSLFPGYFDGPMGMSVLGKAVANGLIQFENVDIRDFCADKHKRVDDRPFGGGPGMVMSAQSVYDALQCVVSTNSVVVYMSASGKTLTNSMCRQLSCCEHMVVLCGHYEGVDDRVLESSVDVHICVGDYVLTNGCVAALVLLDSVCRLVPGVMGNDSSGYEESFESGLLEHKQFTRPRTFMGVSVPDEMVSGNHALIDEWKLKSSVSSTFLNRPDLFVDKFNVDKSFVLPVMDLETSVNWYLEFGFLCSYKSLCVADISIGNCELKLVNCELKKTEEKNCGIVFFVDSEIFDTISCSRSYLVSRFEFGGRCFFVNDPSGIPLLFVEEEL